MLHQKAGADHPYAVVHPAGLPQLSHAGIDDGIAGHALLPAFEVLRDQMPRIGVPPQRALVIIAVALRGVIGELVDHVLRVIAPDHFLGVGLPAVRALVLQLVPDLRGADFAPMQMRGQARGDVLGRQVAPLVVLGNHIAPPFEPIMRGPLAEFPEVADAPGPVGLGRKQVPVGQFVAVGPAVGRMDRGGFGQWIARRHPFEHRFRERRVDLVGITRTGGHTARGEQVIPVVEAQFRVLAQGVTKLVFGLLPPRLVMPHGVDAARAGLVGQRGKHLRGVAPAQHDPRIARTIALAEAFERMMQPDLRRSTIGMIARTVLVEHIDGDDGAGLGRGIKGGLVGHAQIAPQPDYLR